MAKKLNQAATMYPLFFDPIRKKAEFNRAEGKVSIRYVEET